MSKVYNKKKELCDYLNQRVLDEDKHGACELPKEEGRCDYMEKGRCTCYAITKEFIQKRRYLVPTVPPEAKRRVLPKGSRIIKEESAEGIPWAEPIENMV